MTELDATRQDAATLETAPPADGSERPEVTIAEGERQRHDASQPNEQLIRSQPWSLSSRQRNHHAKEETS